MSSHADLRRAHENGPYLGTHIVGTDTLFTEVAGRVGYDYLWIDTEHAPLDRAQVVAHLVAARASGITAFVRIGENDPTLAKPFLDAGADGIIFPMITSAADAQRAVDSCLYPPAGSRGFGPVRALAVAEVDAAAFLSQTHADVLRLIQIETRGAVDELDAILDLPGVDIAVLGPADLSFAFGKPLQYTDPEMIELFRHIAERAHVHGKPALMSSPPFDSDSLRFWRDLGYDLVTVGGDVSFAVGAAQLTRAAFDALPH
ncbi:HpcH/HpaI aldolase/citrate lyase family protein [Microbacterium sp. SORGH_AS_0862]|uniref:HpcH/HpaI aldolase family protein n=1 Tax=Microbacterium sp. SORGH_AS_0862 TaxID=3041789 RepID=UPI0027947D09|nr:aldolase/citrate lyase family protein [Microbacterium sp. SORGH_AS_0862]MDQ1206304.1 2-keto-3-deoxy-L-rhamnonate aldolase RhmA [Microbacterium sp. SORGH_AS_0862]